MGQFVLKVEKVSDRKRTEKNKQQTRKYDEQELYNDILKLEQYTNTSLKRTHRSLSNEKKIWWRNSP